MLNSQCLLYTVFPTASPSSSSASLEGGEGLRSMAARHRRHNRAGANESEAAARAPPGRRPTAPPVGAERREPSGRAGLVRAAPGQHRPPPPPAESSARGPRGALTPPRGDALEASAAAWAPQPRRKGSGEGERFIGRMSLFGCTEEV